MGRKMSKGQVSTTKSSWSFRFCENQGMYGVTTEPRLIRLIAQPSPQSLCPALPLLPFPCLSLNFEKYQTSLCMKIIGCNSMWLSKSNTQGSPIGPTEQKMPSQLDRGSTATTSKAKSEWMDWTGSYLESWPPRACFANRRLTIC